MRRGLGPLIIAAAGIVVILVLAGFFVTERGFESVRKATREQQRAQSAVATATQVEKLVLGLEPGTRGYVLTGDERFLQPWRAAQRQLPGEVAVLRSRVGGAAPQRVDAMWQSYLQLWSRPVIAQARANRPAAQRILVQGEGKRRVDAMRAALDRIIARNSADARAAAARADRAEHNAIVVGLTGTLLRVLIIVVIVAAFLHWAINPLRDMSKAARRMASGERGVTVGEHGAGEVRDLAIAFNEASRTLEKGARDLEQQNLDLERLANVLRAVLDSTVDGILLSDAEGNVQLANRPVVNLTRDVGMSYEGRVVDRLLSVEHRMKDREKYRAAMERLRTNPDEPTFDEFEGTVSGRVFQGFTAPVRDDRGGFIGRVWTLREVTQQRELERLKDEFVATVSHELRTPLTSMMGFLEMLREGEAGELTDEQRRVLAIVYRSSERLQRLVGDLLFVARPDANGLQLQFADVRVDEIVSESVESAAALARSREIDLRADVRPVPHVWADKERLAQLVSNLISNAIKFTPAGGTVTA